MNCLVRSLAQLFLADVYDHPLEAMVKSGEVVPGHADDRPAHPTERDGDIN